MRDTLAKSAIIALVFGFILFLLFFAEDEEVEPVQRKIVEQVTTETYEEAPAIEVTEMTQENIEEEMYFDSLELLAICVQAEAGNQSLEGKRMVADVILNRVDDKDWPNTIEEVIKQPYQFSTYWNGAMDKVTDIPDSTYEACKMELAERGWPGIYYFTAGEYSKYGTPWKQVGDHYFSGK